MKPSALITGAGSRIGCAIAVELARADFDVVLHYLNSRDSAEQTAESCRIEGAKTTLVQADLADPDSVVHLVKQTKAFGENLQVLINNASIFEPMDLNQLEHGAWHRTMQINLFAPLQLIQATIPMLDAHNSACIVNLCDASTSRGWVDHLSYGSSKAGLEYVTRALAKALAPGIRVNGVAPGLAGFPPHYCEQLRARIIDRIPQKRSGTPEEVACAVRFAVECGYLTGQIINVDGGRSIV